MLCFRFGWFDCHQDYGKTTGSIVVGQGRTQFILEWIQITGQIHKLFFTFVNIAWPWWRSVLSEGPSSFLRHCKPNSMVKSMTFNKAIIQTKRKKRKTRNHKTTVESNQDLLKHCTYIEFLDACTFTEYTVYHFKLLYFNFTTFQRITLHFLFNYFYFSKGSK